MAEEIAGIPKKYAYGIGIAAVAVVGYAYWKAGSSTTVVDPGLEASADEYESPLGNSGTNSSLTSDGNVDPDAIDTNAKWAQAATQGLQSVGWEAQAVSSALGKLLAFKTLTATEADIAQSAKGMFGEPPQGGPYPIKEGPASPATTTPGAVKGLKATGFGQRSIYLQWDDAANAMGYEVLATGGGLKADSLVAVPATSWSNIAGLKPNTSYTFKVRARNKTAGGGYGPTASTTAKTKK